MALVGMVVISACPDDSLSLNEVASVGYVGRQLLGEPGSDELDELLADREGLDGVHESRPCDSGHTLVSCGDDGCEGFPGYSVLCWSDGCWQEGCWLEGCWQESCWQEGCWLEGCWQEGCWQEGYWQKGCWLGGCWQEGFWQEGCWLESPVGGALKSGPWQEEPWW